MATYSPISNAEIDPESPIDSSLMSRLRDNPLAIQEGALGAPRIVTAAIADNAVTNAKLNPAVYALATQAPGNGSIKLAGGYTLNWCLLDDVDADSITSVTWVTPFATDIYFSLAGMNKLGLYQAEDTHSSFQVYSHSLTGATVKMEQFIEPNNLKASGYVIALGI